MPDPKPPTPNDQRSDTKNPNNPAHGADQRNRQQQGGQQPAPQPAKTGK